jgi:flagellar biogenesis protein FliO
VFAHPLLAASSAHPAAELGPGVAAAAGVLGLLAAVALFLARRKARPSRLVQIVETASLGPKRSLVVARVGSETLILGASEAGISLLVRRSGDEGAEAGEGERRSAPLPEAAPVAPDAPAAARSAGVASRDEDPVHAHAGTVPVGAAAVISTSGPIPAAGPISAAHPASPPAPVGLLGRLRRSRQPPPAPAFEPLLRESLEDQELRAKVAAGGRRAAP